MGSKIELINCFGDWLSKARGPPRLGRVWEDFVITSLKYVIIWFMFSWLLVDTYILNVYLGQDHDFHSLWLLQSLEKWKTCCCFTLLLLMICQSFNGAVLQTVKQPQKSVEFVATNLFHVSNPLQTCSQMYHEELPSRAGECTLHWE